MLNTLDTFGNCQRPIEEKTPLSDEVVCFQMLDAGTSNLILRSRNQIFQWKIASFLKTILLQRDLFLTMLYTINSSPLLITK